MLFKIYKNEHEVEKFLEVKEYSMEYIIVEKDTGILGIDIMLFPHSVCAGRSMYLGFVPINEVAEHFRISTDPNTGKFDIDMRNIFEDRINMLGVYILQYVAQNYTVRLIDLMNNSKSTTMKNLVEYIDKELRLKY